MFGTIKSRLILIAILVVASALYLYPRWITIRERGQDLSLIHI